MALAAPPTCSLRVPCLTAPRNGQSDPEQWSVAAGVPAHDLRRCAGNAGLQPSTTTSRPGRLTKSDGDSSRSWRSRHARHTVSSHGKDAANPLFGPASHVFGPLGGRSLGARGDRAIVGSCLSPSRSKAGDFASSSDEITGSTTALDGWLLRMPSDGQRNRTPPLGGPLPCLCLTLSRNGRSP